MIYIRITIESDRLQYNFISYIYNENYWIQGYIFKRNDECCAIKIFIKANIAILREQTPLKRITEIIIVMTFSGKMNKTNDENYNWVG